MNGPRDVTHRIGKAEIDRYAELSADHNPLHLDPEFAAKTSFGTVIAHGPIGLQTVFEAVSDWLAADGVPPGVRIDVSYRGPVRIDDQVTSQVQQITDHAGDLAVTVRGSNQQGDEVLQALVLVPRHFAPRER